MAAKGEAEFADLAGAEAVGGDTAHRNIDRLAGFHRR